MSAGAAITFIALSMFFMQFGITCKWILVTVVTPQAYTASAASNQNFAGFLGGTLSPILTGFIVDVTGSFVVALAIGAVDHAARSSDISVHDDDGDRQGGTEKYAAEAAAA